MNAVNTAQLKKDTVKPVFNHPWDLKKSGRLKEVPD